MRFVLHLSTISRSGHFKEALYNMRRLPGVLWVLLLSTAAGWAAAMSSSARGVIPSEVQQVITVDYRMLKNSSTAMALKDQVLPPSLKEFETSLKGVGIDPEKDVDQLTFASYRREKQGIKVVGIGQGSFSAKAFIKKAKLNKVKPAKYRDADLYPMSGGMQMTFLDENSLLFGGGEEVKGALDAREDRKAHV